MISRVSIGWSLGAEVDPGIVPASTIASQISSVLRISSRHCR
jgi:hypothetical protein